MYFLFEWKLNVNVNAIDILLFASRDSAKLRLYFYTIGFECPHYSSVGGRLAVKFIFMIILLFRCNNG